MANPEWVGTAAAIAQVVTLTLGGTWEANDNVVITLYDESGVATVQTVVSGSTTIATICTTVATAINAINTAGTTTSPFYYVLAAATSTTVTLTARTAGKPIYCSVTTTENGGGAADSQTLTASITTANSGPNDWNTAANWSTGVVPADGDVVYITAQSAIAILYGLYQTTALVILDTIELSALRIEQGHPQIGTSASPLCVQYDTLDIGALPADGTQKNSNAVCNLSPGAYAVTGVIRSTASAGTNGRPPVQILSNHASAAYTVLGSSLVGFGTAVNGQSGQVATITTKDTAKVTVGSGITLATLNPEGGTTTLNGGVTTINYGPGAVNVRGTGNVTNATIGGNFLWESTGTITNLFVAEVGVATLRSGTMANTSIYGSRAKINCDSGVSMSVAFTNGVDCVDGASSNQVNFGDDVTVTPTAV